MKLVDLLTPPRECQAKGMPFQDKRKGFMWFCTLARKNFVKGRSKPDCFCAAMLAAGRDALEKERGE